MKFNRFKGLDIYELIKLYHNDNSNMSFVDWYGEQIAYDKAYKIDSQIIEDIVNENNNNCKH